MSQTPVNTITTKQDNRKGSEDERNHNGAARRQVRIKRERIIDRDLDDELQDFPKAIRVKK